MMYNGGVKEQGEGSGSNWPDSKQNHHKVAAKVSQGESNLLFSPQQLEQLARLLPSMIAQTRAKGSDTDEIDAHFSGMISCLISMWKG